MGSLRRWLAPALITLIVTAIVLPLRFAPVVSVPLRQLDETLYDALYRWRPLEDRQDGAVVIVAVDNAALDQVQALYGTGWPWPRKYWGSIAEYLIQDCHAKAVAFDLLFTTRSRGPEKPGEDDDALFAASIDRLAVVKADSLVFSTELAGGTLTPFFPPAKTPPARGVVNVSDNGKWRTYLPQPEGHTSLAAATLRSAGITPRLPDSPFLLHFYGPHRSAGGRQTFRYVNAGGTLRASYDPDAAAKVGIDPEVFRDKIVLVGGIATGLYDLKTTPFGDQYPGVEIQATAVENLIRGDSVRVLTAAGTAGFAIATSWGVAAAVVFSRRAWAKVLAAGVAAALVLAVATALFLRHDVLFARPAAPLAAAVLATVLAFAWSYFGEDRQRRRLLKALSSVVSPHIAEELARDPSKLAVGAERREMTVMFSDIAGFTDLSETLPPEKLAKLLNFYLEEMSGIALAQSGTLDKYIGDAMMCFWNAPLPQADHAALACRAALRLVEREREIQPALRALGAKSLLTRVGISTGPMAVGFTGSSHLVNYTVLGDSVNLGSRLEAANKLYGTRIMVSQGTAAEVRHSFVLRQLDVLRVKGKIEPIAVFELIAEGEPASTTLRLVEAYEKALRLYQKQQWETASGILVEIRAEFPEDGPTKALLGRIEAYRRKSPSADWDGVYVASEK